MRRISLTARIKGLQLRSRWYSLLFAVTRNRRFFDKRIRTGVLMLSLLNLLASCGSQSTEKLASSQKERPSKKLTKVDTAKRMASTSIPIKFKKAQPSCYDVEVLDSSTDSIVGCYISISSISDDEHTSEQNRKPIFQVAEEMPEFPGGVDAMMQYIKEWAIYPDSLKDDQLTGSVFVKVVINTKGEVVEPTVLKGITPKVDSAALQIVRQMPLWKPGRIEGIPVNAYYTITVKFNFKVKD